MIRLGDYKALLPILGILALLFLSGPAWANFVPSQVLKQVAPKYPRDAYLNKLEGYVSVIFVVNEKGEAEDIEVIDEMPNRVFRKAAITALKKWQFKPATDNGEFTTDIKEITIDFKM